MITAINKVIKYLSQGEYKFALTFNNKTQNIMRYLFYTFSFLFLTFQLSSQSYKVEIVEIPYDTLTDYTSLGLEKAMETPIYFVFEQEFEFGFGFPYFDTILHSFIFENESIGYIEGCLEYPMYLFSKQFMLYVEKKPVPNLDSDFRYKYTEIGGKKVFIFEFKKVVYQGDANEPKFNRNHFSFQHWFWENGDLEIRFGESFILPELYMPGMGIKDQVSGNFFPFALTLSNYDLDENINISGNLNDNPTIHLTDTWSQDSPGITYIPEKNTVCRFKKLPTKTRDQSSRISIPTIAYDRISIPKDILLKNYIIYDITGYQLLYGTSNDINIQSLNNGTYILLLTDQSGTSSHKFIKI